MLPDFPIDGNAEFEFPVYFLLQDRKFLTVPFEAKRFLPMWTDEDSWKTFVERRGLDPTGMGLVTVNSQEELDKVFHTVGLLDGIAVDPTERDILTTYRMDQIRRSKPS